MNFKGYNDKGETVDYTTCSYFKKRGSHAVIYKIDDETCLKKFYIPWDKYDLTMFKKYLELELKNFYEIKELLFNQNGKFKGYLMKYYHDLDDNVIGMSSDYVITNYNNILASMDKLGDAKIMVDDLIPTNFIYDLDTITVIDIDNYKYMQDSDIDTIKNINKEMLLKAMKQLFRSNVMTYYTDDQLANYLFNIDLLFADKDMHTVTKKLARYKYPIDYIRK